MSDVVIIKRPSLILDHLINILEKQIHKTVASYDPDNYETVFERDTLPGKVFVEMESKHFDDLLQLIKNCRKDKNVRVIVWLTNSLTDEQSAELFRLGLDGYFDPEMEQHEISYAIKSVFDQKRYIHPNVGTLLLDEYMRMTNDEERRPLGLLTRREWQVLELIAHGNTTKQISKQLYISTKTVTNHIASILRKLNVEDRTNAALKAVKNRWITI